MVPEYYVKNHKKERIYSKIAQISTLFCPNIGNSQTSGGQLPLPPAPLSSTPMSEGLSSEQNLERKKVHKKAKIYYKSGNKN